MLFYPHPVPGVDIPRPKPTELLYALNTFLGDGVYTDVNGAIVSRVLEYAEKHQMNYTLQRVRTGYSITKLDK